MSENGVDGLNVFKRNEEEEEEEDDDDDGFDI